MLRMKSSTKVKLTKYIMFNNTKNIIHFKSIALCKKTQQ